MSSTSWWGIVENGCCTTLLVDFARVQGHNQITDLYLLALAVHRRGCLASFDQGIALTSVRGATARSFKLL